MNRWLASCCLTISLAAFSGAADEKGKVVEIDGLKSTAPAAWKSEEPKGMNRTVQFKIPKAAGDPEDGELVVYHFGKNGGGGVDANIKRWKYQFKNATEGKTTLDKFKVGTIEVVYLDVQGTYLFKFPPNAPNAKTTEKPDFRALNVIFQSPNGPYYFKFTGPAKTVESQKKAFDEWVKNFK